MAPMTSEQLKALLKRAGLSQRGAAKALDVNERTVRRYAAGHSKVPKTIALALEQLAAVNASGK